jgi:hypothetical protein
MKGHAALVNGKSAEIVMLERDKCKKMFIITWSGLYFLL